MTTPKEMELADSAVTPRDARPRDSTAAGSSVWSGTAPWFERTWSLKRHHAVALARI